MRDIHYLCTLIIMRKYVLLILSLCIITPLGVRAQYTGAGSSVFNFMDLPTSSRINALGGDNVSLRDGDISMGMCNPATLGEMTDNVLQLNYSYYLPGTMFGSVLYGHNFGRSPLEASHDGEPDKPNYFAVGIHYLDYGHMQYADEVGNLTGGSFGARDILINAMYARQLGRLFSVGVTLKPVFSVYEIYTSFAMGADVGGHFQTADSTLQMGLVLRNIGWQMKTFHEAAPAHEMLPLNLELGLSYRVAHAPLRFHLTLHNLQHWDLSYQHTNAGNDALTGEAVSTDVKWYDMLFRHTIWAVDIVPKSDKFYLTLSYNHRRRMDMQLRDQRSLAGFGLGAGVRIKQCRVGFAMSQLTRANFSYQLGLTMDINQMMK